MMWRPARNRLPSRIPCIPLFAAASLVFLTLSAPHPGLASDPNLEREVRAGGGCVLMKEPGGDALAVGDCGAREDTRPRMSSSEQDSPEAPSPERADPEGNSPEETEPFEETTGRTAQEPASPGDEGACPAAPPEEATPATVARAIDGDTLEIEESIGGADAVRLIGVDSPELEGGDGDPEPGAEEAAAFTAGRLEGRRVLLQFDREREDGHGRLLAYVWPADPGASGEASGPEERNAAASLFDGVRGIFARISGSREGDARAGDSGMFNLALIEEGHAEPREVEPNTLYAACFERAAGDSDGAPEEAEPAEGQYEQTMLEKSPEITSPEADEPEQTIPEETIPQETVPEETAPEETVSEETVPEQTDLEEPPAGKQYEQRTPPEETEAGDEGNEELSAPAPDEELCPGPRLLDGVEGGEDSSGDAEAALPFETEAGGILLAYAASPADEELDGGMLALSLLDGEDSLVGDTIVFQKEGAELALIEAPAGGYRVEIIPANRRYALDVYECADLEARNPAPEELPAREEPPATPAPEPAPEEPVEEPSAGPAAVPAPDGGWGLAPEPRDTLAARETPEGPAPMLPDTGGPEVGGSVVTLAFGCAMFSSGVLLFVSLRQAGRSARRKNGSKHYRKRL